MKGRAIEQHQPRTLPLSVRSSRGDCAMNPLPGPPHAARGRERYSFRRLIEIEHDNLKFTFCNLQFGK